jgi:CheY-like chemotaxis protein
VHRSNFLFNKEFNDDVAELERLASLGELIAGVTHELNNPLSAILGYAEILQSFDVEKEIKKYVDHIYLSAVRASKIVEGLLTYLRKKNTDYKDIDINDVIKKTLALFEYQLRSNKISLIVDLNHNNYHIKGDFYKLQQVFFNLIINAIHAMERWEGERKLLIRSENILDFVVVTISDTGPGIPMENIDKIFTPFFTTKDNGTGLGLSVAQTIVKEHGGYISVISEKGCTFRIELPICECEVQFRDDYIDSRVNMLNKKVLVVDDDELVLDAISQMIRLFGCRVILTTSAVEGLEELKKGEIDHVLIDYKMPDMNGLEFTEKALDFIDSNKITLITGNIMLDAKMVKQKYNVNLLLKPIGINDLKRLFSNE